MKKSQPSWAAWIEILIICKILLSAFLSQPSWAAWIEIKIDLEVREKALVAALLGCVD